ncbi:MAG: hypothetical protein PHU65_00385 [Actinomycetota bacterium]|nr:hypothetical protein [Actinomycetota bacterium]
MEESIKNAIIDLSKTFPAAFRETRNNILSLDFIIAERKAFLSRQRLTYRCSLKIYNEEKIIRFFEILKESGAGMSTGGSDDDFGPGFGFKVEKTKIGFNGREGTIKEQSELFSKKYEYNFEYEKIRNEINETAEKFGYKLQTVLVEKSL